MKRIGSADMLQVLKATAKNISHLKKKKKGEEKKKAFEHVNGFFLSSPCPILLLWMERKNE